jgi:hypothetical protein
MADIFMIRTLWGTYIWWFCYCYPWIWARRIMSIFCLKLPKPKNCRVYIYIKIKESYKIEELLILGEHLGSSRWFSGSVFILGEHLGSSHKYVGHIVFADVEADIVWNKDKCRMTMCELWHVGSSKVQCKVQISVSTKLTYFIIYLLYKKIRHLIDKRMVLYKNLFLSFQNTLLSLVEFSLMFSFTIIFRHKTDYVSVIGIW